MDDRDARVSRLTRSRRADSDDRRYRVLAIIDGLAADSRPLPVAELARRANVHRTFLYRHPDLYELAVATPLRRRTAELDAERGRLRAVVDAAREFDVAWSAWQGKIERGENVSSTDDESRRRAASIAALLGAVHQLDGSTEATDG